MKHYDLAIVGGSFSGLACAQRAAEKGVRTIVYERKKSPGAYTQTTGIFVKEVAEQLGLPAHLTRKIPGIRLYSPRMECIDLKSEGYYFQATDTGGVLDWMARQVEKSGGMVRCGQKVGSIAGDSKNIVLEKQDIACSYLVGADGAKSNIARRFNLGRNRSFLLGAEYEVAGFYNLDPDYLHVFIDSRYAPGYIGWVLQGVHHAQVGVAGPYPRRPGIQEFLFHLMRHFGGTVTVLSKRGGLIPCGGVVKTFAKNNVCLLGDAAGMVSPLTAGGIHPSVEVGRQLGDAIADYLKYEGQPPHLQLRECLPRYTFKRHLRTLYNHFPPPNWLVNVCLGNPVFQRVAQIIFFHHRGLFCKEAWQEILFDGNKHGGN